MISVQQKADDSVAAVLEQGTEEFANNQQNISEKPQPTTRRTRMMVSPSSAVELERSTLLTNSNNINQLDEQSSSPQSSCNTSYSSATGQQILLNNNNNSNNNNNNNSKSNLANNNSISNSMNNHNCSSSSVTSLVPGGVVTTQNISTVIKPKSNNNSLQFVKIQTPELSKKAVEQIKLAEETKISKGKIKEVEEEWQNNLLNWKSKRRQQFGPTVERDTTDPFESDTNSGRKIKTFAEMIEQRAKSGNRLGFHLQRYIESSDNDEDDQVLRRNHEYNPDLNQHLNHNDNYEDATDNEPTIRRNNSGEYDIHSQQQVAQSKKADSVNNDDSPALTSDDQDEQSPIKTNEPELSEQRRDNNQNISVVDSPLGLSSLQLNSTFRQDVSMAGAIPSPNTRQSIRVEHLNPRQDLSGRATTSAMKQDDESCSEDELYDELEEEQKHLQRVAFEAKLKAFEKLTKPTGHAPRLRSPVPVPATAKLPHQQSLPSQPSRPTRITEMDSIGSRDPRRQNVFQLKNSSIHDNDLVPQLKPAAQPTSKANDMQNNFHIDQHVVDMNNRVTQPILNNMPLKQQQQKMTTATEILSQSSSNSSVATSSPELKSEGSLGDSAINPNDLTNRVSEIDLNRQYSNNSLPVIPDSSSATQKPIPPPLPRHHLPTAQQSRPSNYMGQVVYNNTNIVPPAKNIVRSPPTIVPMNKTNSGSNHLIHSNANNNKFVERQQPLPLPPRPTQANMMIQPTPQQERKMMPPPPISNNVVGNDKEKAPPLQVSGKKRCSSCKEELGRGAAAFVVESLSLVYHTNCFRCSVCHVNLSNGFRGVDVRVHAGALHCQNCYSKDGLNYSRV